MLTRSLVPAAVRLCMLAGVRRANETVKVVVKPRAPGDYRDSPARFTYQKVQDGPVKVQRHLG